MKINFSSFENKHSNEDCIILGPSEKLFDLPKNYKKQKIIAIGDSMIRARKFVDIDYWIAANDEFPIPYNPYHLKIINHFKNSIFIFSDSTLHSRLWEYDYDYLNKKILIDWSTFDERHFHKKSCSPKLNCCKLINLKHRDSLTIQELISKKYKSNITAKQGGTVAEYAFALALFLDFKKITFVGLDLPYFRKDYTYYPDKFADLLARNVKKTSNKRYSNLRSKLKFKEKINIKNIIKKIKNYINKNNKKSIFANDYQLILNNFEIMSSIAFQAKKECYYTNQFSNLKRVNNFKFKNFEDF